MEIENVEAIKSLVGRPGASIVPLCRVKNVAANSSLRVLRVRGRVMLRRLGLATLNSDILPPAVEKLSGQIIRFLATRRSPSQSLNGSGQRSNMLFRESRQ
jgi:hypothetical protein